MPLTPSKNALATAGLGLIGGLGAYLLGAGIGYSLALVGGGAFWAVVEILFPRDKD
jgi:hypothetical protein